MPSIKSATKSVRVAERRRVRNTSARSQVKTSIAKAEKLIVSGELEAARQAVVTAISSLDSATGKGVLHPNNAARHKSRLMKKLNQALASAEAKTETEQTK